MLVILGAGYTGRFLYARAIANGVQTLVTSRAPDSHLSFAPPAHRLAFVAFVVFFLCGKMEALAELFHMVPLRGRAASHLQWRNGHEQKRRSRSAGLADHVRIQHVSVSGLQMGRRNLV